MATMTYLARRSGGLFYVQVRVRFFSGTRTLLRFSLRTASYAEAKTRLCAYLRWLLPMQNPAEIDLILSQVDVFLKEGVAEDAWQAHHRHHYLKTALGAARGLAAGGPLAQSATPGSTRGRSRSLAPSPRSGCACPKTSTNTISSCTIPTT